MMQAEEQEDEQILFDQEGLLLVQDGTQSASKTKHSSWTRKFIKTVVLCIAFFALGLCIAIPGPTLLDLGQRVQADTDKISLIFTARSIGYLLGSILGGFLFDRFDQLLLLFYTLIFTSIATAVAPWCTALLVLAIMIALQGVSMGVLDTGGNVFCIKIWGKKSAPYMQLLHFAFGVGAFIAPLLARPFLMNHELLAVMQNSTLNSNAHPYQGKATLYNVQNFLPVNDDVQRKERAFDLELSDNNTFLASLNASELNLTSTSTIKPVTLPTKPKHTDEKYSSQDDADFSKGQKKIQDSENINNNNNKDADINGEDSKDKTTVSTVSSIINTNISNNNQSFNSSDEGNANRNVSRSSNDTAEVLSTTTITISPSSSPTTESTTIAITSSPTSPPTTSPSTTFATTISTTPYVQPPVTMTTSEEPVTVSTKIFEVTTINETFSGNNNTNVTDVEKENKKPTATSGDIFNSAMNVLTNMSKIQFAYLIIGLLLCVNAFMFLVLYCKEKYKDMPTPQEEKENKMRQGTKLFRVTILSFLFLFFFVYVGMEVTYGGLLSTFSVENMNWTERQGATATAVFWGSVAAGRGIAIFVAKVCSAPVMLVTDLVLVVLGAVILSFGIKQYDIMLWLGTLTIGLGMSSMFPTGISWADHYFPLTGKATGILIVGSALGEMVIPIVTGQLYENLSKMMLMYMMLALSIISVTIYIIMQIVASNKKVGSTSNSISGFERLKDDDDVPLDIIEPPYTNGVAESTRNRMPKVQVKPTAKNESNGEYKRLIDISDEEFS